MKTIFNDKYISKLIITMFLKHFNITWEETFNLSQETTFVWRRYVLYYLLKQHTNMYNKEIAAIVSKSENQIFSSLKVIEYFLNRKKRILFYHNKQDKGKVESFHIKMHIKQISRMVNGAIRIRELQLKPFEHAT